MSSMASMSSKLGAQRKDLNTHTLQIEDKRELLYSSLSLTVLPVVYFSSTNSCVNDCENAFTEFMLRMEVLLFIFICELLKIAVVSTVYPLSTKYHDQPTLSPWVLSTVDSVKLPSFCKHESTWRTRSSFLYELIMGTINIVSMCLICHVILVLLGAPLIQDFRVTLQFSMMLVAWLAFPLFLVVAPSLFLQELPYLSIWRTEKRSICIAKVRFLAVSIAAWAGAIFLPLDWDRPWQKWPIPCVLSATAGHILINICIFVYLFSNLCTSKAAIKANFFKSTKMKTV